MNIFNLESLTNKPTCFQSTSPTCIDLILTNKKSFFKNPTVLEVGTSDHHSFITTALRTQVIKGNVKMKMCRDYKTFNTELFFKKETGERKPYNLWLFVLSKHLHSTPQ